VKICRQFAGKLGKNDPKKVILKNPLKTKNLSNPLTTEVSFAPPSGLEPETL
jgi:hypothetical protein